MRLALKNKAGLGLPTLPLYNGKVLEECVYTEFPITIGRYECSPKAANEYRGVLVAECFKESRFRVG